MHALFLASLGEGEDSPTIACFWTLLADEAVVVVVEILAFFVATFLVLSVAPTMPLLLLRLFLADNLRLSGEFDIS